MESTILLVDDEPAVRDGVKRLLYDQSLSFLEAGDGKEALQVVSERITDLILLDLRMPHMDGFQFLEHFRNLKNNTDTPVCVMTGGAGKDDRLRAIDLGADDFIRKPAEPMELATRIKSLLRIGHYQRELRELNQQLEEKVEKRTSELSASVRRLENAQRETDLAYRETVLRLTLAAEMKDACTSAHLERMSQYSALLAAKCGWSGEDIMMLTEAAKMHDIGKLGVPDHILNKAGKLSKQEFASVQQHTAIGARILAGSKSKLLQLAGIVALTHHERFDGTGYPQGLIGKGIPEPGRIVAIADVFDALMTHRPYKEAWSLEATATKMNNESGRHFDPHLLALFLQDLPALHEIHVRFAEHQPKKFFSPTPESSQENAQTADIK